MARYRVFSVGGTVSEIAESLEAARRAASSGKLIAFVSPFGDGVEYVRMPYNKREAEAIFYRTFREIARRAEQSQYAGTPGVYEVSDASVRAAAEEIENDFEDSIRIVVPY